MKIALVRHFKVKKSYPKRFLISYEELVNWFEEYDLAEIEPFEVEKLDASFERCYCSTMKRAKQTATHFYSGEVILQKELEEVSVLPLFSRKIKLPLLFWGIMIRNKTLSENPITLDFRRKIEPFIEKIIEDNCDTLIVSHGFVMMLTERELRKRGFVGKKIGNPKNGKMYLFER
ncbi:MAG: histidine phosphatase family protein [Spirosomataceae bacterium]